MDTICCIDPIYRSAAIAARRQMFPHLHEIANASLTDVELPYFLTVLVTSLTVPAEGLPHDWRSDRRDISPVCFSYRKVTCVEVITFGIRSRVPLKVTMRALVLLL